MRLLFGIFSILPVILSSCASSLQNPHASQTTDLVRNVPGLEAAQRATRLQWARRDQLDSLKGFIESQKVILTSTARREKDFILMARAQYLLAEYFTESRTEKLSAFAESANWAEVALLQNRDYRAALHGPSPEKAPLVLQRRNAEGLFWHASALAKWAELSGVSTTLKYRGRIESMMERVHRLRPDYFYGGVHRFFGSHFGLMPGLQEDDLARSRKHFEAALRAGPDFFANHVSFAEIYGKKVDNRVLMRKHLGIVARGDPLRLPDFRPEQVLEQRRAHNLLKGVSQ
jgi:hypothetical protein